MNPQEYMKNLGRDGAYVEADVRELQKLAIDLKAGELPPKMLDLKSIRLELTDQAHVEAFCNILKQYSDHKDTIGMDAEQLGFFVFRKVFEHGLFAWGGHERAWLS